MGEDIVERLRAGDQLKGQTVDCKTDRCNCALMEDAAEEILSLRSRISELEEGMRPFADRAIETSKGEGPHARKVDGVWMSLVDLDALTRARSLLPEGTLGCQAPVPSGGDAVSRKSALHPGVGAEAEEAFPLPSSLRAIARSISSQDPVAAQIIFSAADILGSVVPSERRIRLQSVELRNALREICDSAAMKSVQDCRGIAEEALIRVVRPVSSADQSASMPSKPPQEAQEGTAQPRNEISGTLQSQNETDAS